MTDRAANVPAYFAGNWVEVRDAANVLKGHVPDLDGRGRDQCQDGDARLVQPGRDDLAAGDKWQGVYRFDNAATVRNGASLTSVDPIRVGAGSVRAPEPAIAALRAVTGEGSSETKPPLAIRSVSLCSGATILSPGGSLTVCAAVEGEGDLIVEATRSVRGTHRRRARMRGPDGPRDGETGQGAHRGDAHRS